MIYYSQLITTNRILLYLACILFHVPLFKYPLGNVDCRGFFFSRDPEMKKKSEICSPSTKTMAHPTSKAGLVVQ